MGFLQDATHRPISSAQRQAAASTPAPNPLADFDRAEVWVVRNPDGRGFETRRDADGAEWVDCYTDPHAISGYPFAEELDVVSMSGARLRHQIGLDSGLWLIDGRGPSATESEILPPRVQSAPLPTLPPQQ